MKIRQEDIEDLEEKLHDLDDRVESLEASRDRLQGAIKLLAFLIPLGVSLLLAVVKLS